MYSILQKAVQGDAGHNDSITISLTTRRGMLVIVLCDMNIFIFPHIHYILILNIPNFNCSIPMANKLADECKTLNIRCLSTFNCAFLLLMGILSNSKNIEVNCESYFCQTNTDIMDVKLQVCGLLVHI